MNALVLLIIFVRISTENAPPNMTCVRMHQIDYASNIFPRGNHLTRPFSSFMDLTISATAPAGSTRINSTPTPLRNPVSPYKGLLE